MTVNKIYNTFLYFFLIWFALSLAQGTYLLFPTNYLYPYFSWRLFDRVKFLESDFAIELVSLDGKELKPPQDFVAYEVPLNKKLRSLYSQPHRTVQRLGQARNGNDYSSFSEIKKTFETHFLNRYKYGEYQLVFRTWDPLEALQNGKYINSTVLKKYRFDNRTK